MRQGEATKRAVMHAVLAQGEARPTHDQLAALTEFTPRTVGKVVSRGKLEGHLEGGRPARFGVGVGLVLAASVGTASLRVGLVDANGVIRGGISEQLRPRQLEDSPNKLLARIRAAAVEVLEGAIADDSLRPPGSPDLRLAGLAVAWPSPVNRDKRPKGKALKHPSWHRSRNQSGKVLSFPERLARELGRPFTVDRCHALNDASAHALAIAFEDARARAGEAAEKRSRVCLIVRVGGGLGASVIVAAPHRTERLSFIDSKLLEGTNGLAGELGHLPVGRRLINDVNDDSDLRPMDYDSWRCSCGKPHHLEAFASGMALLRRLRESGYDIPESSDGYGRLLRAIAADDLDDDQRRALRDIGRIVGRAMAAPTLMLDPYSITVTGALAGKDLVAGMRDERKMWASVIDDSVEIRSRGGDVGAWAGVRGAGLAVLRRTVYKQYLDGEDESPETFTVTAADIARLRARVTAAEA